MLITWYRCIRHTFFSSSRQNWLYSWVLLSFRPQGIRISKKPVRAVARRPVKVLLRKNNAKRGDIMGNSCIQYSLLLVLTLSFGILDTTNLGSETWVKSPTLRSCRPESPDSRLVQVTWNIKYGNSGEFCVFHLELELFWIKFLSCTFVWNITEN